MNIPEFIFSKKILVISSGLIFAGVTFASSGAQSLLQNNTAASEAKIPEVQKIEEPESSPMPAPTTQQTFKTNSPVVTPKPAIATTAPSPASSTTPKPSLIPSLTQPTPKATVKPTQPENSRDNDSEREDEDDSRESNINEAFQRAKEED